MTAIYMASLDTTEPVADAPFIMAVSPPYDQIGTRQCKLINLKQGVGFAALKADYNPARGLIFDAPVGIYHPTGRTGRTHMGHALNQSNRAISADPAPGGQ